MVYAIKIVLIGVYLSGAAVFAYIAYGDVYIRNGASRWLGICAAVIGLAWPVSVVVHVIWRIGGKDARKNL